MEKPYFSSVLHLSSVTVTWLALSSCVATHPDTKDPFYSPLFNWFKRGLSSQNNQDADEQTNPGCAGERKIIIMRISNRRDLISKKQKSCSFLVSDKLQTLVLFTEYVTEAGYCDMLCESYIQFKRKRKKSIWCTFMSFQTCMLLLMKYKYIWHKVHSQRRWIEEQSAVLLQYFITEEKDPTVKKGVDDVSWDSLLIELKEAEMQALLPLSRWLSDCIRKRFRLKSIRFSLHQIKSWF